MKESKLYQCEFCFTQYKEKEIAVKCEKNHKKPNNIVKAEYSSFKSDESGLPKNITVCIDGRDVKYSRY